jgi:rSAM/selenodomain-associated transferase 1
VSTLIVIAKEPVPGRVKTRLTPAFSPREAAELAEAALADTLRAVRAARADHRLLVLDGKPGRWLPPGFAVEPQVSGTLDARIAAAFAEAARQDTGPALLIGMDTPQVSPELLEKAFVEMEGGCDTVFGPAEDGGFWALGLREPAHPRVAGLFLGVPMSRPETGRLQLERLTGAGLRVAALPPLRDVDTADDAFAAAGLIPGSAFARRLAALAPASWNGPVSDSYERALWLTLSQDGGCVPILLEGEDGESVRLDVAKYAAAPDATDAALLDRCTGPTLDIGCGPGRLSAELARRGVPSLGVDVAPVALLLARAAGATTLRRSVFDPLPGEGRWPHALLIDGNIGIGGDPAALLTRIKALLQPAGGELVVETAADDVDERHSLRVEGQGAALPWARLGTSALRAVAEPLGYTLAASWQSADRHFVALTT